ncbi:hypothetical protein ALC53_00017, partial [Atta colombica]
LHNTMDRNCPVLKKYMEISQGKEGYQKPRIMAFDNLPFFEKLREEKNINSLRMIPVKSMRNFSRLPDMDSTAHETQRSYIDKIIERILTDKDAEVLCERIKKITDLHNATRWLKKVTVMAQVNNRKLNFSNLRILQWNAKSI